MGSGSYLGMVVAIRFARNHWPTGVPKEESLSAFQAVFASLGYIVCEGHDLEAGHEKIAIFAASDGVPTHAARQLASGRWTSKIGKLEDIEHELMALAGSEYGSVAIIMKRPELNP